MPQIKYSIVVPVYNEVDSILKLHRSLSPVVKKLKGTIQIIYIDDGSTDGTTTKLEKIAAKDSLVSVIQFRRNFGQTAALAAGFDLAQGEIILTMDGDLQNDPKDIPRLIDELNQGYDLVSGWRKHRKDDSLRMVLSQLANQLINRLSGLQLHDYGCTLKAYRQDLVKELRLYGEMHRFIPAIAARIGARISEVEVNHQPRLYGKSKYGLGRTFRVMLDILMVKFLLDFQTRPLHLFGSLGLLVGSLGGVVFTWLSYEKFFLGQALSDRPLFLVSVFMVLVGIQFITIGILAEMLMRVYYESQDKKPYYIRRVVTGST